MNILFMDMETTGTNPDKHRIIEVACRLDVNGKTTSTFHKKFFNPAGAIIDLGALKVNSSRLLELFTPPSKDADPVKEIKTTEDYAIVSLIDYLLSIKVDGPLYICGHNVHFDMGFLKATLKRYDVENIEVVTGYRYLDTVPIAIALKEKGKLNSEKIDLRNLAKALSVDLTNVNLHTAVDDVNTTAAVLYRMFELI